MIIIDENVAQITKFCGKLIINRENLGKLTINHGNLEEKVIIIGENVEQIAKLCGKLIINRENSGKIDNKSRKFRGIVLDLVLIRVYIFWLLPEPLNSFRKPRLEGKFRLPGSVFN